MVSGIRVKRGSAADSDITATESEAKPGILRTRSPPTGIYYVCEVSLVEDEEVWVAALGLREGGEPNGKGHQVRLRSRDAVPKALFRNLLSDNRQIEAARASNGRVYIRQIRTVPDEP